MQDKKEKSTKDFKSGGEKAVEKFTEMMVERMQSMKASDWRQGWTNGKGTMLGAEPQRPQLLGYELFLPADGHGNECLPHSGVYDLHAGAEGESPY